MPKIAQQVSANEARIAAGGQTGTGVGPQNTATANLAPPQDLPAGGGLPQRGMFPADLTLNSDRSDSNRAFRGAGVRSSTFPYAPAGNITSTIVEKAQNNSSSSSSSFSNLTAGPGISITASGKGFTVSGQVGSLSVPNIFTISGSMPLTAFPDAGPIVVSLAPEPVSTFFAGPAVSGSPLSIDTASSASGTSSNAVLGPLNPTATDFAMFFICALSSGGYQNGTISAGWTTVFTTSPARLGVYSQSNVNTPISVTDSDSFTQWSSTLALFHTKTTPIIVQSGSKGSVSGSDSITFSSSLTAGNSAVIAFGGNFTAVTSISDSEGNTYQLAGTSSIPGGGGTISCTVYVADNILGGTAATVNFILSGVNNYDVWYGELSGFELLAAVPTFRIIKNTDLDNAVFGAAGTNSNVGAVPDPGSISGTSRFLREDATWDTPFYQTVQQAGVSEPHQIILNFLSPITATNNSGNGSTDINVPVFVGSGASHATGLVPDPGASAGTTHFLREDATWVVPPSGGGGATVKSVNYTAVAGDSGKLISFNTGAASFSVVQSSGSLLGSGSGTQSFNLANTPMAGNFIVACVLSSSATAPTISGGGVGTWTQIGTQQNRGDSNYYGQLYYGVVDGTPSKNIQATSLGSFWGLAAFEVSGTPASFTLEGTAQGSSSGTTLSHGVTTTASGDIVFGLFYIALTPASSWTAAAGFTVVPTSGNANTWLMADVVGAASTYTPQINWGGASADWGYIVTAFKPGSASALTLTLPAVPPSSTWFIFVENYGTGTLSIDPNGNDIDGSASTLSGITQNQGLYITTDGTNYFTMRGGA